MTVAQISHPKGDFEFVQRPLPEPDANQVRIKVEACGVCHSDNVVKDGDIFPVSYPRVPGHEVVGIIDKVGANVKKWKVGQRVGVGWHGGHDFICDPCRRGDFINCENALVTGLSFDGGYGEYMVAPAEAVALVPESLTPEEAAPLLCAGVTTYNALRHSGAMGGDLVAIQGIGGLGHLAIQYSHQMGFKTVAISGGADKKQLALGLGAHVYIDSSKQNPVEVLHQMGGAKVIIATAPNSRLISSVIDGLGPNGKLMVIGVDSEPMTITPTQMLEDMRTIQGWNSGHAKDEEDTMDFGVLTCVRPMIEVFPFEKAPEAYAKMISGKVRFRAVLKME